MMDIKNIKGTPKERIQQLLDRVKEANERSVAADAAIFATAQVAVNTLDSVIEDLPQTSSKVRWDAPNNPDVAPWDDPSQCEKLSQTPDALALRIVNNSDDYDLSSYPEIEFEVEGINYYSSLNPEQETPHMMEEAGYAIDSGIREIARLVDKAGLTQEKLESLLLPEGEELILNLEGASQDQRELTPDPSATTSPLNQAGQKAAETFMTQFVEPTAKLLVSQMERVKAVKVAEDGTKSFEAASMSWNVHPDGLTSLTRKADGETLTPQNVTAAEMKGITEMVQTVDRKYGIQQTQSQSQAQTQSQSQAQTQSVAPSPAQEMKKVVQKV